MWTNLQRLSALILDSFSATGCLRLFDGMAKEDPSV